jgi:alpha-galactosidase
VNQKGEKTDVFPMLPTFIERHFQEGIYEGKHKDQFKYDTYAYGNKVKMDLFRKYGILAAAGDRHLVEFFNNNWYLENLDTIHEWAIAITPVSSRIDSMNNKIQTTLNIISGKEKLQIRKSSEEAIDMMKAILGLGDLKTNVNFPNIGQMSDFSLGSIVETNCLFSKDQLTPIPSKSLPTSVNNLCLRNSLNIDSYMKELKIEIFKKSMHHL